MAQAFIFEFERQDDRTPWYQFFSQLKPFLWQLTFSPRAVVETLNYIDDVQAHLKDSWAQMDRAFDGALATSQYASIRWLEEAGLTGIQLRTKLRILQSWAARLVHSPSISVLRRLLANINSILGSFIQATGSMVAEMIKEFKEMIENAIDDVWSL